MDFGRRRRKGFQNFQLVQYFSFFSRSRPHAYVNNYQTFVSRFFPGLLRDLLEIVNRQIWKSQQYPHFQSSHFPKYLYSLAKKHMAAITKHLIIKRLTVLRIHQTIQMFQQEQNKTATFFLNKIKYRFHFEHIHCIIFILITVSLSSLEQAAKQLKIPSQFFLYTAKKLLA